MIPIMFSAILGGLVTFAAWEPQGIFLAFIVAMFGGSISAAIAGLTIAARNPE